MIEKANSESEQHENKKEQEATKRTRTELVHPLPDKGTSIKSHFDIIKAYGVAYNAQKRPLTYEDLEPYIRLEPNSISGCNKFFESLSLLTRHGGGKYIPTPLAIELYNQIKWENEPEIKRLLSQAVRGSWFYDSAKSVFEVNNQLTEDELIKKLGLFCGADPEKHTRPLRIIIDYLRYIDTIEENDGKLSFVDGGKTTSTSVQAVAVAVSENRKSEGSTQGVSKSISDSTALSQNNDVSKEQIRFGLNSEQFIVNLNFNIGPDTSEEHVRKIIRAVKEELSSGKENK